jgi:predicted RNA methylase
VALVVTALLTCGSAAADAQTGRLPDIGYEPTPYSAVDAMLSLAHVGPSDVVYDLGSGDGRIPITAARVYGARAVGVELQAGLVNGSRRAAQEAGVASKVRFIEGDFFDADLSEASVVTLYLWPTVNDRLEAKLRRELRPGSRIVSYTFPMGKWVPDETVRLDNGRALYLWTVPRRPVREPDLPFVPTPSTVIEDMLQLAQVNANDTVYDLGSGDGRVVIMAAQNRGARGVGIEIVPSLVDISRKVAQEANLLDRVTFVEGDLYEVDASNATVVTLYLSASVNARLEPKLRALRPGTRIVSRQFPIGTWAPDKTVRAVDGIQVYLWIVRAR